MSGDIVKELQSINANYDLSRGIHFIISAAAATITAQAQEIERLKIALEAIETYPPEGDKRRTKDGYPSEVVYDEYAYKRIVDAFRFAAREAREETTA